MTKREGAKEEGAKGGKNGIGRKSAAA